VTQLESCISDFVLKLRSDCRSPVGFSNDDFTSVDSYADAQDVQFCSVFTRYPRGDSQVNALCAYTNGEILTQTANRKQAKRDESVWAAE
jgi:hypothetical protein